MNKINFNIEDNFTFVLRETKENKTKHKNIFKHNLLLILLCLLLIFIIVYIFIDFFILKKLENQNITKIINEPIIPEQNQEYTFNKYNKQKLNHIRYNFQQIYENRKLFKINYSFFPYTKVNKLISYKDNAEIIYNSTGMLNITKLDFYFNNIDINTLKLNHIHISMAFDNKYVELSLISIASLLNTSNPNTYIHFHILCLNFGFKDMEKIIQLKRINKNVDFIFYNAKQAEYDFIRGKKELRGVGNYAKILSPQIVNNTNKLIIMDSGDIIAQKDISEIFYFNLENNYFGWILEDVAGNFEIKSDIFFRNNFYPNAGVCLVNITLFRKDKLYKKAFFFSKSYSYLGTPFQDILVSLSIYKFKYLPLKYNCKIFFDNNEQIIKKINYTKTIERWVYYQRYSPYKYSINEILEAAYNPVISHFYQRKIHNGKMGCNIYTIQWIKYAKLTGFYKEIKLKYPKPFICEKNITK